MTARLCRDQLIGQLVALFRSADPQNIDDAVAQAKGQLTAESKQAKSTGLEQLFDAQIAKMKDLGVPEQIVEMFQNQKLAVVAKASEMTIGDGNSPFLPVISRTYRSPYDLMTMVKHGAKAGYSYLNPNSISDVVEAPSEPYYAYDVEDGHATRGKSPEQSEKILKSQKRSPLTVAEVTSLTTYKVVLSQHYVWAAGSRYESSNGVPGAYLDSVGRPELVWDSVTNSNDHWGSASCGSRCGSR